MVNLIFILRSTCLCAPCHVYTLHAFRLLAMVVLRSTCLCSLPCLCLDLCLFGPHVMPMSMSMCSMHGWRYFLLKGFN